MLDSIGQGEVKAPPSRQEMIEFLGLGHGKNIAHVLNANEGNVVTVNLADYLYTLTSSVDVADGAAWTGDEILEELAKRDLLQNIIALKLWDSALEPLVDVLLADGRFQSPIGCCADDAHVIQMNGHHRLVAHMICRSKTIEVYMQAEGEVDFDSTGGADSWDYPAATYSAEGMCNSFRVKVMNGKYPLDA